MYPEFVNFSILPPRPSLLQSLRSYGLKPSPAFAKSNGDDSDRKLTALLSSLVKKSAEDGKGRFDELLYAEKLRKRMPEVRVVVADWYAYDGAAWMEASRHEFLPLAFDVCPKKYRKSVHAKSLLDNIEGRSQVRPDELIGFHKFFTEDDGARSILINALNGVVKVWPEGVITLEKHDPAYGFTSCAAAEWKPEATCPLFQDVLASSLPDPLDRDLLRYFAGSILWPSAEFETALISYGPSGTGKSTIAEAIAFSLSDPDGKAGGMCTFLSMVELCHSKSYSVHKLQFSALNLCTEVDTVEMDESTNFKLIVSGENIEARPIYGKPRTIRPTTKLWSLANTLPRFKTGTTAELRRLRFLHHDILPEKRDTKLKGKLRTERNGIFRWMIEGLIALQASDAIPAGGAKSQALAALFGVSNDPVTTFLNSRCEFVDAYTSALELQNAFDSFVESEGLNEGLKGSFLRRFYERCEGKVEKCRATVNGVRCSTIRGVKIKEEA